MQDESDSRILSSVIIDFISSELDKKTEVLKIWRKGFDLGYFDLGALTISEASMVFSKIHEIKPELGYQLLYMSISNYFFGEVASMCFYVDGELITDWVQDKYIMISDGIKLIKATPEFFTTEIFRLRDPKILEEKKVNLIPPISLINPIPRINLLLASRCLGTAIHAHRLALQYLKEIKLSSNYYHVFEKLGEIFVEIKSSESLLKASLDKIETEEAEKLSKMALWKSAVTAVMAVDEAVVVQEGAYKYREDFKIEVFRNLAKIKHRNPKIGSIYDLRVSEIYYPETIEFYPGNHRRK